MKVESRVVIQEQRPRAVDSEFGPPTCTGPEVHVCAKTAYRIYRWCAPRKSREVIA